MSFIDPACLRAFDAASFRAQRPFPWAGLCGFLTADGFAALHRAFPDVALFERHENRPRPRGPRPHDRYYLAYEASVYHPLGAPGRGEVRHRALPDAWRAFIEELNGAPYRAFLSALVGGAPYEVRYAWHLGFAGSEVSPHRDAPEKLATQLLYFNTAEDWSGAWGGETLVLGGPRTEAPRPDFGDFETEIAVPFLGNRSLLFANGAAAWHGMRAIRPPAERYRRVFNVIVSRPAAAWRRLGRRALRVARRAM